MRLIVNYYYVVPSCRASCAAVVRMLPAFLPPKPKPKVASGLAGRGIFLGCPRPTLWNDHNMDSKGHSMGERLIGKIVWETSYRQEALVQMRQWQGGRRRIE